MTEVLVLLQEREQLLGTYSWKTGESEDKKVPLSMVSSGPLLPGFLTGQ